MDGNRMNASRLGLRAILALGVAVVLATPATAQVRTLNDALALTYATNPTLLARIMPENTASPNRAAGPTLHRPRQ